MNSEAGLDALSLRFASTSLGGGPATRLDATTSDPLHQRLTWDEGVSVYYGRKKPTVLQKAGGEHDPMPQPTLERPHALTLSTSTAKQDPSPSSPGQKTKGFAGAGRSTKAKKRSGGSKRSDGLSKGDWGPMGKHPDLDAIVARQRLHLPLSGRLTAAQVNQAWKRCAAEHHPDRGGAHDTMQLVNGARDLLLGRDLGRDLG